MGSKGKWAATMLTSAGMLALAALVAEDVRRVAAGDPYDGAPTISAYELRLASWLDEPLGARPGCGEHGGQSRRTRR